MPNHVTNRLTITGENLQKFLKTLILEEDAENYPHINFDAIIPSPESLSNTAAGGGREYSWAKELCGQKSMFGCPRDEIDMTTLDDEALDHFVELCKNIRDHGYSDWYGWNVDNWGTKWNAYSQELYSDCLPKQVVIRFDTAWAAPHPIIEKMAEGFEGNILHEWADEDTGNNVGNNYYIKGELVTGCELSDSKEGYELAFDIYGGAEYYKLSDDGTTYEYDESTE